MWSRHRIRRCHRSSRLRVLASDPHVVGASHAPMLGAGRYAPLASEVPMLARAVWTIVPVLVLLPAAGRGQQVYELRCRGSYGGDPGAHLQFLGAPEIPQTDRDHERGGVR